MIHGHARRRKTTSERDDDGLPGHRPHGRLAPHRTPRGRDDPQALPDVRTPPAGPRGRRNGHDRRPLGQIQERNLLDEATLRHNQEAIKAQLSGNLLDFDSDAPNAARMVNNYDWMKEFSFLDFIRDIGKVHHRQLHDGQRIRSRSASTARVTACRSPSSPTRLVQGYDFLHPLPDDELQDPVGRCRPVGQHHHRHGGSSAANWAPGRSLRHHLPADHQRPTARSSARPRKRQRLARPALYVA